MRWVATLAIALTGLAGGAAAQGLASSTDPLSQAAFAPAGAPLGEDAAVDVSTRLLDHRDAYALGEGPKLFQSGQVALSRPGKDGPVDSLRVNTTGVLRTPGGLPLNLDRASYDAQDIDVTLIRSWPKAVRFKSDGLAFDVSPHAGLGVSSGYGAQAEGGATLTVSKSREDAAVARLKDMGVKDGASFGDQGRWYLFAAASGRAVGLNMLRGEQGWSRAGWSTDATSGLVGDAQVGVGWRKGDMQSSFGVIHREVKGQHMIFGQETRDDTVAAFNFSIRPGR